MRDTSNIAACVLALTASLVCGQGTQSDDGDWNIIQNLRKVLLKNYSKGALPHRNANGTTTVYLMLQLRSFLYDEQTQIMDIHSWMAMIWNDDRLKWDYKDYAGLKKIRFGDKEIWKPDLHVYNNADVSEIDHYGNVHCLAFDTGLVYWVPPASMKVFCEMDIQFWPFDEQKCEINLGSWTHDGLELNLEFYHNTSEVDLSSMVSQSNEWQLVQMNQYKHTFSYVEGVEVYHMISYSLHVKRQSATFTAFVVVPALAISLSLLIQFILPVDHPQRLNIGFVCFILVLLELLFLKMALPKLQSSVPFVVIYYSQTLIVVVLSMALNAFLGRLVHAQNPLLSFPPPEMLKRALTGPLATVLGLRNHASKVGLSSKMAEDGEVLEDSKAPNYSHEWLLVAKVVDRLALVLFVAIFVISLIAYIAPLK